MIIQYHTAFYVPYKESKDDINVNTQERHVSVGTLFYLPCLIRDDYENYTEFTAFYKTYWTSYTNVWSSLYMFLERMENFSSQDDGGMKRW